MEAEKFSVRVGPLQFEIITHDPRLRAAVEPFYPVEPARPLFQEGLFIAQPSEATQVGQPAWVLYESGDIVLRRSRSVRDIADAVLFHLATVEAALTSALLPLRVRSILLPDGSALLVTAAALHDLAGHDRRLRHRGCLVLPTTLALVDSTRAELVLPTQPFDPTIPSGRVPIRQILVRDTGGAPMPGATTTMAIARAVVRDSGQDLVSIAHQVVELARLEHGIVHSVVDDEIKDVVKNLPTLYFP